VKGGSIVLLALLIVGLSLTAQTERIPFDEGEIEFGWNEGGVFLVDVRLNEGELPATATWVMTLLADRFADGVFAWQLHTSEGFESLLVIPNDFLTIRNFLPAALDIEIVRSNAEGRIEIRIPRKGPIPNLVSPGDRVRIHALWIRSEPLVEFAVPERGEAAGGGGSAKGKGPRTDPLPEERVFYRGETIENSFVLIDPETGKPRMYVAASYSLLRLREGEADQFLRFAQIAQDPDTGIFSYEIDTTRLTAGEYRLIISIGTGDESSEKVVEIIDPEK